MASLGEHPTREEVLRFISNSASFGNLGVFIGAGFSKAVLNDEFDYIALSWGELLNEVAKKLGIDYNTIQKDGVSYPDIASVMCQMHCEINKISYEESLRILKRQIADLTSWYPDLDKRKEFSAYLKTLGPSWIITTNYDLVIESLLTGIAIPLGPNDPLVAPTSVIPVYHLHGIRTNPEEIIIVQEDYVTLFRPNEYRQIKLALTIRESTTLIIGYGLGDVNVLTALDWSKNVFSGHQENYPHEVIQILRKDNPKSVPYRDKHGIIIIEASSLPNFFKEFLDIRNKLLDEDKKKRETLNKLAKALDNPQISMIKKFIDDQKFRKKILKVLSKFPIHLISGFVPFLNKCIDETWRRSEPSGAFEGYNQNLIIILDILTVFKWEQIPPALFQTTAYALQRVGYYIGNERGKSWAAKRTWDNRKTELSDEIVHELYNFADRYKYNYLLRLVKDLVSKEK